MATGYRGPLDAEADRRARRWFETSNPAVGVGAKHHTVPAFCLRRFADSSGQLLVRDRSTGRLSSRAVSRLAVTDFYTALSEDGQFDGRMEQLLSVVESEAAEFFKLLLSPFRRQAPFRAEEQVTVCQFLTFQMTRGPRRRREMELLADYVVKVENGHVLTGRDLRELTAVPHPNHHLRMLGPLSYEIYLSLLPRPAQIMRLDEPLLVICDEPVIVDIEEHVQHKPECFAGGRAQRKRRQKGAGTDRQLVHVWPTRPSGAQLADAIAMPLSPSALLVLGRAGERPRPELPIKGDEARDLAQEVNAALVGQAYEWIAARPGHPTFRDWSIPPPGPLLGVCDGGSVMSRQLQAAPSHRWQRIRKDWPRSTPE